MKSLKLVMPFGDHVFHLAKPLRAVAGAEVGDGHVEGVVDAGFAAGLFVPNGEGFAHGGALFLEGKVDDGGGATDGSGLRAGGVVVGGGGAAEGHVKMGVDVDAAGEDEEVCRVDEGVVGWVDVGGYGGDLFAFDEDVGVV